MDKIKFVRTYIFYGHAYADIIYYSGRVKTCLFDDLPQTAIKYMQSANNIYTIFCKVYNRPETIFEK